MYYQETMIITKLLKLSSVCFAIVYLKFQFAVPEEIGNSHPVYFVIYQF